MVSQIYVVMQRVDESNSKNVVAFTDQAQAQAKCDTLNTSVHEAMLNLMALGEFKNFNESDKFDVFFVEPLVLETDTFANMSQADGTLT